MDYFPNVDGINFFAKEIFPLIRNKRPGAALRIVGSNPVKSVQELAKGPNVSVTGYVADVRQAMSDAAVSIAPLRIARGTQNKILESMAMGIPVVATSKAAKGLGVNAQARLLIADDRQTFADQVISVLDDDDLGMRLSAGGREYVEAELSWSNALLRLDDLLAKAGITHEKCSSPPHPW
jgi:glycosyltransferase involved in cell wall biosynthesis